MSIFSVKAIISKMIFSTHMIIAFVLALQSDIK